MWVSISNKSELSIKGRDIVDICDFKREDFDLIFEDTATIKKGPREKFSKSLEGKFVGLLFFEPSTRTHGSFWTATKRLGGNVYSIREPKTPSEAKEMKEKGILTSSVAKGETLTDTIKMFDGWEFDCAVIRNDLEGTAKLLAEKTKMPIINGGDGANQHPTQSIMDGYTIKENKGNIDGLNIGILGDLLHGRTVPSLSYLLSNYDVEISFIAPKILQVKNSVLDYLDSKRIKYEKVNAAEEVIRKLDILYVTRVQAERIEDPIERSKVASSYVVNLELLKKGKQDVKVMHPLPRVDELSYEVDDTPYALYFEQARNGLYTREALLLGILNGGID